MSTNWKAEYKLKTITPELMVNWDSSIFRLKEKQTRIKNDLIIAASAAITVSILYTLLKIRTLL
jgi:hypothetical protein